MTDTDKTDTDKLTGPDAWMTRLEDILVARRAKVSRSGALLQVQFGRSFTAAKAEIDPSALWLVLEDAPLAQRERLLQGFASGVHNVLLEPARSKAEAWDYAEAAASLMPNLEVFTFRLGAEAAGSVPWTQEFQEDLIFAFVMDLNIGRRVLTQAQFDRWPATASRVTAAARSILYHKSRNASVEKLDGSEFVQFVHVGDDYDAIRSIILADLFFGDIKDEFRFSMPSQDALLFVEGPAPEQIKALKEATDTHFDEADYPLSRSIYTFERGQPILDEPRNNA